MFHVEKTRGEICSSDTVAQSEWSTGETTDALIVYLPTPSRSSGCAMLFDGPFAAVTTPACGKAMLTLLTMIPVFSSVKAAVWSSLLPTQGAITVVSLLNSAVPLGLACGLALRASIPVYHRPR